MNPNQRLSRVRPPMAKKPILDMFRLQRLAKQRIRAEIDHSGRQIIAGMPVCIRLSQLFGGKRRWDGSRNFNCASHSVLRHLKNWSSARMTYFAEYSSDGSGSPKDLENLDLSGLFLHRCEGAHRCLPPINSSPRFRLDG